MTIDTHCHLEDGRFNADRDELITAMKEDGMGAIVVGTDFNTSSRIVEVVCKHDNLGATVGIHPVDNRDEQFDSLAYRALAEKAENKVVAIGECGFDFFHADEGDDEEVERQTKLFVSQIKLANELGLPLMLHVRDKDYKSSNGTYDRTIDVLDQHAEVKGNVHFYQGSLETARKFWALGFTTSFAGSVTFSNEYNEVVREAPTEMIMAETDCPWVAPVPHRGERNEPRYVKDVIKKMAEIRGITEAEMSKMNTENAGRVFGLA